jgi:hypothetical protein
MLFDPSWYLHTYPDVAKAGANPLRHYLEFGAAEGRDPSPFFCTRWYLETYPDVAKAGANPLRHYLEFGAAEGRDPSPRFCTRWYLETYPDVAKSGVNPLQHYLSQGAAEGRLPAPTGRGPSRNAVAAATDVIKKFSDSDVDLARLLDWPLGAFTVASDLPVALSQGWRSLYLTLDVVPRALLIVPSLDEERLRRLLLCLCNQATVSKDPSALLVVAVDEAFASTGIHLPNGTVWRSLAEFRTDLDFRQKVAILVALIHGLRPQGVLVLDSQVGWEVIAQHGATMCRYSGLFAAFVSSTQDRLKEAEECNIELRYLRQCLPSLAAVYVENAEGFESLRARYRLSAGSRQKFRLLPTAACDAEWVSVLSKEPGFLSKKKSSRP